MHNAPTTDCSSGPAVDSVLAASSSLVAPSSTSTQGRLLRSIGLLAPADTTTVDSAGDGSGGGNSGSCLALQRTEVHVALAEFFDITDGNLLATLTPDEFGAAIKRVHPTGSAPAFLLYALRPVVSVLLVKAA